MSDLFSQAQLEQLAAYVGGVVDQRLAKLSAAPVATPVAAVVLKASDAPVVKTRQAKATPEEHAAFAAKDTVDPARNAYTTVARNRLTGVYDHALYVPLWTALRDRLVAEGMGRTAANHQAQAVYDATLKAEMVRLRNRDGLAVGQAPVIDPDRIKSNMPVSDPTGNRAVANVLRLGTETPAEKLARLRAELTEAEASVKPVKLQSAASTAQKAIAANPYERTVAKLVKQASMSGNAGNWLVDWFTTEQAKSPTRNKILIKQATEACQRLGIPVRA